MAPGFANHEMAGIDWSERHSTRLFAAITSIAIGWTYLGTKAQIDFEVRRAEARQLLEIFPPDTHDNEIVDDAFEVAAETALLRIR